MPLGYPGPVQGGYAGPNVATPKRVPQIPSLAARLQQFLQQMNANQANDQYDPEFAARQADITRELTFLGQNLDLANLRDRETYTRNRDFAEEQWGKRREALTNALANRGILRSGNAVWGQSELGQDFQRQSDVLARQLASAAELREREALAGQNAYSSTLTNLLLDRTRRREEREAALRRARLLESEA